MSTILLYMLSRNGDFLDRRCYFVSKLRKYREYGIFLMFCVRKAVFVENVIWMPATICHGEWANNRRSNQFRC